MKGKHLVTIFHNEQNLYTVLRIRVEETNERYDDKEAVITGYFPRVHEQESYIFFGEVKEHPKFGTQFQATHYRKDLPQSKQGIVSYLSSDLFKGIGKKTAEKIVETLGEKAIARIMENPSLLDQIPKLAPEKAKDLYDTLMEQIGRASCRVSV